jgi:hypothetical protein
MSDAAERFHGDAAPVLDARLIPRPDQLPLLVLVVDDSDDDELVSVIADAATVPASGYEGAWTARATVFEPSLAIKFHLTRAGDGWVRRWTLEDPAGDILDTITDLTHNVAVLPKELAGDQPGLLLTSLGGAIIVEAPATPQIGVARAAYDIG